MKELLRQGLRRADPARRRRHSRTWTRVARTALALLLAACGTLPAALAAGAISAHGERLASILDSLDVEHHWPAGEHVAWETGVPDGKPERMEGKHTHCSAFVAAAAKRLGVYILRPPQHGQVLLANAQYDWLAEEGAAHGWIGLADGDEAQARSNHGELVVAAYRNRHDDKPGHIAIVRPSAKSAAEIRDEGPQIIQAGTTNHRSVPVKAGFAGHPAAWSRGELRYYAHSIDWSKLGEP